MLCLAKHKHISSLAALGTSENITLDGTGTLITFFFGPEVLIPKDNIINATEQCFEIGLHCAVEDHPTLVNGSEILFTAYVQTDLDIRSSVRNITLIVSFFAVMIFHAIAV